MALEARIDADLALGRHRELVPELDALVATHPFREHLLEQLVLALYRSGRQAEALDADRRGTTRLRTSSASSRAAGCRSSSSASCARIRCSTHRQRALPAFMPPAGLEAHSGGGMRRARRCRRRRGGGCESRQRRLARLGPARRRDHRYVERASRRADSVERDQVSGARVHRERQFLGVDARWNSLVRIDPNDGRVLRRISSPFGDATLSALVDGRSLWFSGTRLGVWTSPRGARRTATH